MVDIIARSLALQSRLKGNPYALALGNQLSIGYEPACILLQGDSTGNDTTEWFYKTMQWLAEKYPAYTFLHRLWNDANQNYAASTVLQVGASGRAYATMNGTASYLYAADTAALRVTGDIDVAVKVALDDWTPTVQTNVFMSKFGSAGGRGWTWGMNNNGRPYLWWSADGTILLGGLSSYAEATAAPTVADGADLWIRFTMDVDNGAGGHTIRYYTGTDGVAWTQLGADRVGSGTTSIFASTDTLEIGARTAGSAGFWSGKVYEAVLKNGIDGDIVASPNLGMAFPIGTTTFKDGEGNTWTSSNAVVGNGSPCVMILNGSMSGAVLSYSTDVTRFGLQTPMEPVLAFINYGHNETTKTAYQTEYEGLATQLLTKYPNVGVVCVTQNPQKDSAINAFEYPIQHGQRNRQIATLAAKNKYGLIDAYRAFMETGDYASYINDDGVHPTQAGFDLWASTAINFLRPSAR